MRASRERISTKLLSFSGIDGAGKTTQIRSLRASISEMGLRSELITFWDDVATLTRIRETTGHRIFKGDNGVGTPSAPINRRDKNVRSGFMTCARLCLYLLDALSLRSAMKKASCSDADVVIFDRFIYDELANLALGTPVMQAYIWLIMKLVPRPHISYLLDADPGQARARKPEYPLEFLLSNRQSYLDLSRLIGGITVIAPMPIEQAEREVLDVALRELPASAEESLNLSGQPTGLFAQSQVRRSSHPTTESR